MIIFINHSHIWVSLLFIRRLPNYTSRSNYQIDFYFDVLDYKIVPFELFFIEVDFNNTTYYTVCTFDQWWSDGSFLASVGPKYMSSIRLTGSRYLNLTRLVISMVFDRRYLKLDKVDKWYGQLSSSNGPC